MVAIIIFCLVALAMLASGTAFSQEPDEEKSWVEQRAELKEALPRKVSEWRTRIERLRIVRRPRTVLSAYQADPSLWESMARFYDFIKMRELDVYEEQEGIPGFFPDRDTYYDFLDTMLPAMRDRRFERNRILCYQVHEIRPAADDPDQVIVIISVTSDDILPFGKLMVYTHHWLRSSFGWYPGKVHAEPATWWERIR